MALLRFETGDGTRQVEVPVGTVLLEAARLAGVTIEAPCNGAGVCGKCKVRVDATDHVRQGNGHFLSETEMHEGWVLACEAQVVGDLEVAVPRREGEGLKIHAKGACRELPLEPWIRKRFEVAANETLVLAGEAVLVREVGNTTSESFGLVVDIGTTTLVAALVDLQTGEERASESALNPQALHGQDVLSRIQIASKPEGLALLQGELIRVLNGLLANLTASVQTSRERIYEAVFSGNTAMLHIAVGQDPSGLGRFPYVPSLRGGEHVNAAGLGLHIHPRGLVYLPPILSAYVGADITSGLLATDLAALEGVTLFVDIGTNGEMVLARNGKLTATSTAAGPAFEGMNITCGMRAGKGAVEGFEVGSTGLLVKTIGDAEPAGLCGSGLVDLVGELAHHGALDRNGRFAKATHAVVPHLNEQLVQEAGKPVFRVAGPVFLTQKDVRQVQLAKGAVRAGIDLLLKSEGLMDSEVDRVLIAGSFGYHLRTRSLIQLGLLPAAFADRVAYVGNTSQSGGWAFLISAPVRADLKALAREVTVLELANDPTFEKTFVAALAFPERAFPGKESA